MEIVRYFIYAGLALVISILGMTLVLNELETTAYSSSNYVQTK